MVSTAICCTRVLIVTCRVERRQQRAQNRKDRSWLLSTRVCCAARRSQQHWHDAAQ